MIREETRDATEKRIGGFLNDVGFVCATHDTDDMSSTKT